MIEKVSKSIGFLKVTFIALVVSLCVFGNEHVFEGNGFVQSILAVISSLCSNSATQGMIILWLSLQFLAFLVIQWRYGRITVTPPDRPTLWLAGIVLIGTINYFLCFESATKTAQALVLFVGVLLGQAVKILCWQETGMCRSELVKLTLLVLLMLNVLGSLCQAISRVSFQYQDCSRWTGVWTSPNIAGLLMGVGLALAFGLASEKVLQHTRRLPREVFTRKVIILNYALGFLWIMAVAAMGCGLLRSYSRGACLATGVGLAYLLWQWINCKMHNSNLTRLRGFLNWLHRNGIASCVLIITAAILLIWHFQHTEWHPARRMFSSANQNDFSWRNRLSAWNGAFKMIMDKPCYGYGWNQADVICENYYYKPQATQSALQTNDFLVLGTSLGTPVLFGFIAYVWLCVRGQKRVHGKHSEMEWVKASCRAGTIVLLVGFWFDGALFQLPTAVFFWILVELGRDDHETVTGNNFEEAPKGIQKRKVMDCSCPVG